MVYLRIVSGLDLTASNLEADEDDFQSIENQEMSIVRWNEKEKCFEHLVCESETDPDDEDNVDWSTKWIRV